MSDTIENAEYNTIGEMEERKSRWVDETKALRNFEGIKDTLTKLYTSSGHFVYELLQNAEDALAENVTFDLRDDRLVFSHDGKKLFSLGDIDSITNIGDSTKIGNGNNIGKFGIGFKSVFEYTNRPEITSGDFHFAIEEIFVPVPLGKKKHTDITTFDLPFDSDNKKPDVCFAEIFDTFKQMNVDVLLFLKNINHITFIENKNVIEFMRVDEAEKKSAASKSVSARTSASASRSVGKASGNICTLKKIKNKTEETETFLRYFKKTSVEENGASRDIEIACAFSIVDGEKKSAKHVNALLKDGSPCGKVYTFFPCTKEKSNLCFHVHAPFALTVSRETLREENANTEIIDKLGKLLCDAVEDLKVRGMVDMELLKALPNKDEYLGKYERIKERVIKFFNEEPLVPMKNGGFDAARGKYKGASRLLNLFSDDDLKIIFRNPENDLWIQNPRQVNQRDDKFLQSLDIKKFDMGEFVVMLDELSRKEKKDYGAIIKYLQEKNLAFFKKLYLAFFDAMRDVNVEMLRELKLCRCDDKKLYNFSECYLSEKKISGKESKSVCVVDYDFFQQTKSKHQSEDVADLRNFFTRLRIEKYSILGYGESLCSAFEKKRNDEKKPFEIFKLIEFYNDLEYYEKSEMAEIFKKHKLFKSATGNFCLAEELFVGKSYGIKRVENISLYFDVFNAENAKRSKKLRNVYAEISDCYIARLGDASSLNSFVLFAETLGVETSLPVSKTSCVTNDAWSKIKNEAEGKVLTNSIVTDEDYDVIFLDKLLENPSEGAFDLVWDFLISTDSHSYAECSYRNAQKYEVKMYPSQLVNVLCKSKWVLQVNEDGSISFENPSNAQKEKLPVRAQSQANQIGNLANWLLTLDFGENHARKNEEYKQTEKFLIDNFGLPSETLDLFRKMFDVGADSDSIRNDLKTMLDNYVTKKQERAEDAKNKSDEISRLEKKSLEKLENSDDIEYAQKMRSVRVTGRGTKDLAKVKLASWYTSEETRELICQICHEPMPFKDLEGEYYFEAVQIFRAGLINKELDENYAALCPVCAAKYKVFMAYDEQKQKSLLAQITSADSVQTDFEILLDTIATIHFTERHVMMLRNVKS